MRASSDRSLLSTFAGAPAGRAVLTAEAERALVDRFRKGDSAAAGALVRACLPFVFTVALEYRRWGIPIEDIVQEGCIGFLKAAERFDASKGCRLITYAAYWIRAEIRDYVVRSYRIVRLGASKGERRALRHYRRTRERDPRALAVASGLSPERVEMLLPVLTARDVDLDGSDAFGGASASERLAHPGPSPEDEVAESHRREQMARALEVAVAELPERERTIIQSRWLQEDPLTLEQVGSVFGISKERVRQLEERAKKRVRERITALLASPTPAAA